MSETLVTLLDAAAKHGILPGNVQTGSEVSDYVKYEFIKYCQSLAESDEEAREIGAALSEFFQ